MFHCHECRLSNTHLHAQLHTAGDKSGEAVQDAVEADDEDFKPEDADKADEVEKVRISMSHTLM